MGDKRGPGIETGVKAAISIESARSRTGVDATWGAVEDAATLRQHRPKFLAQNPQTKIVTMVTKLETAEITSKSWEEKFEDINYKCL